MQVQWVDSSVNMSKFKTMATEVVRVEGEGQALESKVVVRKERGISAHAHQSIGDTYPCLGSDSLLLRLDKVAPSGCPLLAER